MRQRVDRQRIPGQDRQPPRMSGRHLGKRGQAARVALDRHHVPRPLRQQAARQPAGAGPDLQHVAAGEITGAPGDLRGQVQVEEEILPQGLARAEAMGRDHLAQRRQGIARPGQGRVNRSGHGRAPARVAPSPAAMRSAATRLAGLATPWPAMS